MQSKALKKIMGRSETGTIIPLFLIAVIVTIINPNFLSVGNIQDILRTSSYYLIVGAPLTLLLISGDMDLSIGSVTALGGVVTVFAMRFGMPSGIAIILGLLVGTVVGLIKSALILDVGMPSFIATLGLQYAVNGIVSVSTEGLSITGVTSSFKVWGQYRLFGSIYLSVIIALLIAFAMQFVLSKTKYGRAIVAVGGNAETAYLAGISVKKKRRELHALVSAFAAFTGIMMASRFGAATASAGSGTELTVMAAVIIGGTSLYGGSGSVIGSILGCILLATISNALVLIRVQSFWTNLIFGLVLLCSVAIDLYRQRVNNGV